MTPLARLRLPFARRAPAAARRLLGDGSPPPALPVELIVPATRCLALVAEVPQGFSDARLREHLPQWLEELWQGTEAPALALGAPLAGGRRAVFAADAAALVADLERFGAAGGQALRLLPAAALLPADDALLCVSLDPALGRCARHGQRLLALDAASPPLALRHLLAGDAPRPREIVLLGGDDTDPAAWSAALGLPCRRQADWDWRTAPAGAADFLADRRLHPHAARAPAAGAALARLRPAATALCAAGLVAAAGEAGHAWRLAAAERALRAEMEDAFRAAFPAQPTVVDPLRQARRQLAELRVRHGEADAFAALLAASADALTPLAPDGIERLAFRDGRLHLRLAAGRAIDGEQLAAAMQTRSAVGVRFEGGELQIGGER